MPSIFRITHFNNLDFILKNGIHCCNSGIQDPTFVNIGNPSIISRRNYIQVPVPPGGVLNDYVPFYLGVHSPMLLQIFSGLAGGIPCTQEDIIYIVSNDTLLSQNNLKFVFTDGHAVDHLTRNFYNSINDFNKLDWRVINDKYWANTEDDPDRQRRKQAEFLVFQNVPVNCIFGIGVYNSNMKNKIDSILLNNNCSYIPCKVKTKWYY